MSQLTITAGIDAMDVIVGDAIIDLAKKRGVETDIIGKEEVKMFIRAEYQKVSEFKDRSRHGARVSLPSGPSTWPIPSKYTLNYVDDKGSQTTKTVVFGEKILKDGQVVYQEKLIEPQNKMLKVKLPHDLQLYCFLMLHPHRKSKENPGGKWLLWEKKKDNLKDLDFEVMKAEAIMAIQKAGVSTLNIAMKQFKVRYSEDMDVQQKRYMLMERIGKQHFLPTSIRPNEIIKVLGDDQAAEISGYVVIARDEGVIMLHEMGWYWKHQDGTRGDLIFQGNRINDNISEFTKHLKLGSNWQQFKKASEEIRVLRNKPMTTREKVAQAIAQDLLQVAGDGRAGYSVLIKGRKDDCLMEIPKGKKDVVKQIDYIVEQLDAHPSMMDKLNRLL